MRRLKYLFIYLFVYLFVCLFVFQLIKNTELMPSVLSMSRLLVDRLIEQLLSLDEISGTCHIYCTLLLFYFIFVLEHKTSTGLVSCVTALYLFSKIHPSFLVPHAKTLLPYLSSKCSVCFIYELLTIITLISLSLLFLLDGRGYITSY